MPLICGVDENGLGPRLGPLVATAVTLDLDRGADARALTKKAERLGIGDSKAVSAHGDMAWAESVALAALSTASGPPEDADALLAAIAVDGVEALRAPCPREAAAQCWGEHLALPAFGGDVREGRAALDRLAKNGARLVRTRSAIACAKVYGEGVARRRSKLSLDLELFEGLLLDARTAAGIDLDAICGMVGGIRSYRDYFLRIDPMRVVTLDETKGRSSYRVHEFGTLTFEVDADAGHLAVALASMIGKYVRELSMARLHRFYAGHVPGLTPVSGYHDPVTARFVEATAPVREKLRLPVTCFERAELPRRSAQSGVMTRSSK
jgi:ribonuclease HII